MIRNDVVETIKSLAGDTGHKKILEVYNSQQTLPRGYKMKYSDAWCAATVTAVFLMHGWNGVAECGCGQMIEKAKKLGIWVESDDYRPAAGDIIMYDWQDSGVGDNKGVPDHTGIVLDVTGETMYVREGNKDKTIGNRVMRLNSRYIRGYIVPPYEKTKSLYTEDTKLKVLVDDILDGRLGNGELRRDNIYNVIQGLVNERLIKK